MEEGREKAVKQIIAEIRSAFKGVKLGSGVGLIEANAMDDYRDEAYRAACREQDEQENWERIAPAALNQCHAALSYMDDESMRFHLPAFMLADMVGEYKFDLALQLMAILNPDFIRILDENQKGAMKSFLAFIAESPEYEDERENISEWMNSLGIGNDME